jgi:hypothetical protein
MLRVEVYALRRGIMVRLIGACAHPDHVRGECEGGSVQTRVSDADIAVKGVRMSVYDAIGGLMWEYPEITEYVDH